MNKPKKNKCEICGINASFNISEIKWGRFCKEHKLDKLLEVMEEQISRIEREENKDLVEIIKLFY